MLPHFSMFFCMGKGHFLFSISANRRLGKRADPERSDFYVVFTMILYELKLQETLIILLSQLI